MNLVTVMLTDAFSVVISVKGNIPTSDDVIPAKEKPPRLPMLQSRRKKRPPRLPMLHSRRKKRPPRLPMLQTRRKKRPPRLPMLQTRRKKRPPRLPICKPGERKDHPDFRFAEATPPQEGNFRALCFGVNREFVTRLQMPGTNFPSSGGVAAPPDGVVNPLWWPRQQTGWLTSLCVRRLGPL